MKIKSERGLSIVKVVLNEQKIIIKLEDMSG
jgi:hypothetical protein